MSKRSFAVDVERVKATYRSPDRDAYPELAGYTREEIYEDNMGGGALYLAANMVRTMDLKGGDIVLDLGCGKGTTAIFLARHFGVRVVAVDLWVSATFLNAKFSGRGYRDRILPLNLDVARPLPFAEEYFDAIFCMNSLSFYGGSVAFLRHLLKHLKVGGELCIGMETLSEEFAAEAYADPPPVYNYNLPPPDEDVNVWESDFSKMHSPPWWERLFKSSGLVQVNHCSELQDAAILYEDLVLYNIEHDLEPDDVIRSIAQLEYGRDNRPYKTLLVLTARKL
jgi:SAM-dependent methyltransferase